MSGAAYPCAKCGMSFRNSVHNRKRGQFGYHVFEERKRFGFILDLETCRAALEDCLDEMAKVAVAQGETWRIGPGTEFMDALSAAKELL